MAGLGKGWPLGFLVFNYAFYGFRKLAADDADRREYLMQVLQVAAKDKKEENITAEAD